MSTHKSLLIKPDAHILRNRRYQGFYFHSGGVDTKMIGALIAPLFIGTHIVIRGAVFIDLLHISQYLFVRQMLAFLRSAFAALEL